MKPIQIEALKNTPNLENVTQYTMIQILNNAIPTSKSNGKVTLSEKKLDKHFPPHFTAAQREKVIIGLLDRMSCAQKNKWIDEENRVYIIYPIAEIAKDMNISKRKAISCMAELVEMGLVEKKHMGQGRTNVFYLKKFVIASA